VSANGVHEFEYADAGPGEESLPFGGAFLGVAIGFEIDSARVGF